MKKTVEGLEKISGGIIYPTLDREVSEIGEETLFNLSSHGISEAYFWVVSEIDNINSIFISYRPHYLDERQLQDYKELDDFRERIEKVHKDRFRIETNRLNRYSI